MKPYPIHDGDSFPALLGTVKAGFPSPADDFREKLDLVKLLVRHSASTFFFRIDGGKNTIVGERVFINMGCKFQDQGGITIGDGAVVAAGAVTSAANSPTRSSSRCLPFPRTPKPRRSRPRWSTAY